MKAKYRSWISSRQMFTYFTDGEYSHRNINGSHLFDWDNAEQFSETYDKHGSELYQGDILKIRLFDIQIGVVEFHVDRWMCTGCASPNDLPLGILEAELIGNIHENKDLL